MLPFEVLTGELLADLFTYYNIEKKMFARAADISVRTIHNRIADSKEIGQRFKNNFTNVIKQVHKYRMKHGFDSAMDSIPSDEFIKRVSDYFNDAPYTSKTINIIESLMAMNYAEPLGVAIKPSIGLMVGKMAKCFKVTPEQIVEEALFSWLGSYMYEFVVLHLNVPGITGEMEGKLKSLSELNARLKSLVDIRRVMRIEVCSDRALLANYGPDSSNPHPKLCAPIAANLKRHELAIQQYDADFEKLQHEFIKLIDELGIINLRKPLNKTQIEH